MADFFENCILWRSRIQMLTENLCQEKLPPGTRILKEWETLP